MIRGIDIGTDVIAELDQLLSSSQKNAIDMRRCTVGGASATSVVAPTMAVPLKRVPGKAGDAFYSSQSAMATSFRMTEL